MEDAPLEFAESNKDIEVAPALISVHPTQKSAAVAVGSDLRVFNLRGGCAVTLLDDSSEGPLHKDSIRAIRYGADGKLFVSAGDDKHVKIWSTESWRCITTVYSEKRVSAVAISNNGSYVCFADKFGVVWVVDLDGMDGPFAVNKKAVSMLSHYCSIITSLEFSPNGKFLVTADRDFKIRVTVFPKKPLDGAHVIQSFCLGHTEFVSCIAFACAPEYPQEFLVSGSGDSTVRLWDISSGSLLDTCQVDGKAGLLESNGREEENSAAITDLCTNPDGTVVAVAVQSLQGIILLKCNPSDQTLSLFKVVSIAGDTFIPTSLAASSSTGLLWLVTGVSNLPGSEYLSLARVSVISAFERSNVNLLQPEPRVLEDNEIPGGSNLLEKLQGSTSFSGNAFSAAAEAVRTAMSNLLRKKQYFVDNREFRKRTRNDRKFKH